MFPDDPSTLTIVVIVIAIIAMVAVAAYYLVRLLRSFRLVRDELMPLGGKVAFWVAVAYLVFPIDALPDPLLIDDIAVVATAVNYISRLARNHGIGAAVAEVIDAIDTTSTDGSEPGPGTTLRD